MVSELLLQNVISVSKETIDKLGEIAPIIIIGAIWLFAAIAKAVAAGKKGRQPEPELKPSGKPHQPDFNDFVKIVRERYAAAREQVKRESEEPAVMPRPAPRPYQVPTKPARVEAETVTKLPFIEVTIPAAQPEIEKPSAEQLAPPLAEEHPAELDAAIGAMASHPYLTELAEQYTEPDGLRKAILHYEILGTPLALRE
jgi:hypothetical protein